ncbi:hypothetical protein H0H81_009042 [Sphagnurus paluster]|uniref:Protein-S-isoprenylcysteine O-methyltransferase n=1 Tax=Sphagnurus paluster TaxID=117069 RepID=A0A9P7GKB1_9AGAR|nr:hypothetical protein H0H81_009042 [Sphagnurus paluster]
MNTSPVATSTKAKLRNGRALEDRFASSFIPRVHVVKPSSFLKNSDGAEVLVPLKLFLTTLTTSAAVLTLAGGVLRFWCYRTLDQYHTFQLAIVEGHRLIKTGPYGVVRHPSYTAYLAMLAGSLCWLWAPGSLAQEYGGMLLAKLSVLGSVYIFALLGYTVFALGVCGVTRSRMQEEDAMLQDRFGKEWEEWARKVPYRLVPGLY